LQLQKSHRQKPDCCIRDHLRAAIPTFSQLCSVRRTEQPYQCAGAVCSNAMALQWSERDAVTAVPTARELLQLHANVMPDSLEHGGQKSSRLTI